jgi:hypothetical protein
MFYRCIKVQHKPINFQEKVQIQRSKETECALVWSTGLSGVLTDSARCTRTVQSPNSHSRVFPGVLRYNSPDYPVCHRTVRCDSGATTTSRNGQLQKRGDQMNSEEQCVQSQSRRSEAHRTVQCH